MGAGSIVDTFVTAVSRGDESAGGDSRTASAGFFARDFRTAVFLTSGFSGTSAFGFLDLLAVVALVVVFFVFVAAALAMEIL
jgi:hypothetical protein